MMPEKTGEQFVMDDFGREELPRRREDALLLLRSSGFG
jgi:hypothetical protein